MSDWEIGDVVVLLNREGPKMTIGKVYADSVECLWFDAEDHLQRALLDGAAIRKVRA